MQKITEQLHFELEKFNIKPKSIKSLFIGGGTPSTVMAQFYKPFFEIISPYLCDDAEITSEANPTSATTKWIEQMREFGLNRLSFGVQSFNNDKLKFLGRNHTPKIAIEALSNAHKLGIKNISLDLIYATSYDTIELLENDLSIASSLPINHISAYALGVEENTPFYGRNDVVNESEEMAKEFVSKIIKSGFPQYEISNFGTYQSVHNKGYWEHDNYIGIGSGAVGFLKNRRFYPSNSVEEYIKNTTMQEVEILNESDLHIEKIFLGLRSVVGVPVALFSGNENKKIELLIKEKKVSFKDGRIYNNDYFLSDEIALFITS